MAEATFVPKPHVAFHSASLFPSASRGAAKKGTFTGSFLFLQQEKSPVFLLTQIMCVEMILVMSFAPDREMYGQERGE